MEVKELLKKLEIKDYALANPEEEVYAARRPDCRPVQQGVIYILGTGDALQQPELASAVIAAEGAPECAAENLAHSDLPATDLLSRAEGLLLEQARLDAVYARLAAATAAKGGLQTLLDRARDILGNPMILVDTSYKIIAYNPEIVEFNPRMAEQHKLGYMLTKNIEDMKRQHIYEEIRQTRSPGYHIHPDDKIGWIHGLVFHEGIELAQLAMPEMNHPFGPSDLEIVQYLCHLIGIEMQKDDAYLLNRGHMHSVLLCDLLEGLIADETMARLRAGQLGWALEDRLCLMTVFSSSYKLFDSKTQRIAEQLQQRIPRMRWALYQNKAVFLLPYDNVRPRNEDAAQIEEFCANNDLVVACSAEFDHLLEVRTAYEQTLRSYELGMKAAPTACVHYYEDYVCRHIGALLAETQPLHSFCHPGVLRLKAADQPDGKLLATLRAYLKYPDDPGAAAAELYIHKNTLFYRMRCIREEYGLDLSRGGERAWIQLSLEFLQS